MIDSPRFFGGQLRRGLQGFRYDRKDRLKRYRMYLEGEGEGSLMEKRSGEGAWRGKTLRLYSTVLKGTQPWGKSRVTRVGWRHGLGPKSGRICVAPTLVSSEGFHPYLIEGEHGVNRGDSGTKSSGRSRRKN